MVKTIKKLIMALICLIFIGLLVPQHLAMPVKGANKSSYHPQSYWYYPWGKSGTHKGVDIFARQGTEVRSATIGWVIYKGYLPLGGNVVCILGPKWRIHYYAHLQEINVSSFSILTREALVGKVGDSGNAKGKAPHLHYAIITTIPYIWRVDRSIQGWKKMFYLNPIDYLEEK